MSSDDKEFKRKEQRKKRGSRAWLADELDNIEASGGISARKVAAVQLVATRINSLSMKGKTMKPTPEFRLAMAEYQRIAETIGAEHPAAMRAFMIAMQLAPDEFMEIADEIASELDLMPESTGYLADGTPLYQLDDLAAKLGITLEEAEQGMHEMLSMQADAGLPISTIVVDSTLVHRKQ